MTGITLLLNAAEQRLQFGLIREDRLVCGQDWAAASQGAELLAPALADALARLNLPFSVIDRIACVTGPGGFTGLRLALATASALRHTLHVPLAGLNYLELLAEGAPCLPGQAVRVLTHARRELVHRQDFQRCATGEVAPLSEPTVAALPAALADLPLSDPYPTLLIGSGLSRHPELLARTGDAVPVAELYDQPTWAACVRLAGRAIYGEAELEPRYLRASEAEDNLEMLAARRGDDPGQARTALRRLLSQTPTDMARK